MHKFLRAAGFANINKRSELKNILKNVLKNPDEKQYVTMKDDSIAVEYRRDFSDSVGIAVCGEFSDDAEFDYEFYYPYFRGDFLSSHAEVDLERHLEKETYAGVFDDGRIGISIIFFLQNRLDYLKASMKKEFSTLRTDVNLSALAISGSIMLPIKKDQKQIQNYKKDIINRNNLINAARQGDEEAMETLTLEDIDTYTAISRKILDEDVFSLVDTYLMPYGIESDIYSILGEILNVWRERNSLTNESIYIITLNCNDLVLEVCINKKDLVGEPAKGRRFKGTIWLQGMVDFSVVNPPR